jgi:hypothetical protein
MILIIFGEEYKLCSSSLCCFLVSCYFLPLYFKYSLWHTVLKHPQSMFFPYWETKYCTVQNKKWDHIVLNSLFAFLGKKREEGRFWKNLTSWTKKSQFFLCKLCCMSYNVTRKAVRRISLQIVLYVIQRYTKSCSTYFFANCVVFHTTLHEKLFDVFLFKLCCVIQRYTKSCSTYFFENYVVCHTTLHEKLFDVFLCKLCCISYNVTRKAVRRISLQIMLCHTTLREKLFNVFLWPNIGVERTVLLHRIRKVLGSKLGPEIGYPVFRFPQFLQPNAVIVL